MKKEEKMIEVNIPAVFKELLTLKKRVKLYYGGRSGGKSYAFADSLLLKARQEKLFIVCLREIQSSIKDSVKKLLEDRIEHYGFQDYKVFETRIENQVTGSVFAFKGLRDQDPQKIKSLEGADIAWIEEAQTISKKSFDILLPTIRKKGSEIWISMNRELENDPVWVALGANPDENTFVKKVNFYDNPFCPKEMIELALKTKKTAPEDYQHIWLGEPVSEISSKLIAPVLVRRAQSNSFFETTSPLVIGLDIARFGDDESVFCFRRGRIVEKFEVFKKKDTVQLADIASRYLEDYQPKKLFMDIGANGAGVYDILMDRGFGPLIKGVFFGAKAMNPDRYVNKRAEMWDGILSFLSQDLEVLLPQDDMLFGDLTSVNKKYDAMGRLLLESKEEIKKRLGRSPDRGDALALTFAAPVFETREERFMKTNLFGAGRMQVADLFQKPKYQGW
ncbi:MAG: PBSX family phage terminase large subunit [Alphaproteobacteria bacterium]|nr:PBSX family phage terminase large subunit [Alphaproteobacteria bacterium]